MQVHGVRFQFCMLFESKINVMLNCDNNNIYEQLYNVMHIHCDTELHYIPYIPWDGQE